MKISEEEIIRLIHKGFDLELLAFELEIPIEQLQSCKEKLELRIFAKDSIKNGKIDIAIEKLSNFIENTENNLVERMMLLKLNAYKNKTIVAEEDLQKIEEEGRKVGFSNSIDEILDELKVQIPRRKNSNIKKKDKQLGKELSYTDESSRNSQVDQRIINQDYEEAIKVYKKEIALHPEKAQNKRNLLAFAYLKANRIDEARDELMSLVNEFNNYMAYRQLIHLEKTKGNFEDAKLWAYEAIEKFPNAIEIREQLILIAREEGDNQEIIRQLREINKIAPENKKIQKSLKTISYQEER